MKKEKTTKSVKAGRVEYLTVSEIARRLKVSQQRVSVFLKTNDDILPKELARLVGKRLLYRAPDIIEFIEATVQSEFKPIMYSDRDCDTAEEAVAAEMDKPLDQDEAAFMSQNKLPPIAYYQQHLLKWRTRIAKIRALQEQGRLVDREAYERDLFDMLRVLRSNLYSMIEMMAESITPDMTSADIYDRLKSDLDKSLNDLVDKISSGDKEKQLCI